MTAFSREINLLPRPVQTRHRRRIYLKRLGHLQRHVIGVLLVGLAVIGGAFLVAQRTKHITVDSLQQESLQHETRAQELAQINGLLTDVRQWRDQSPSWLNDVDLVFREVPPGVRLREIRLVAAQEQVELRGLFTSREALTLFQRRLEELSWVARVEAPLSNFATTEDAQFSLTLIRQAEEGGI